ncbi:TraM recognition domain-containing protein [Rhizobium laguerreae]|nr:TraM recognition domain-containing protein [Rhizobium laguerreae]
MSAKPIHGAVQKSEIKGEGITRDTRGLLQRFLDSLRVPTNMMTFVLCFGVVSFIFPAVADICLLVAALLTMISLRRVETAPLKLPIQSGLMDSHERNPATGKPQKSGGIFYLGNELRTGKEVWLTNSDCRQHFLVLGTTGAGKALPLDAKVHTPTGWRRMGDIAVGDLVTTPDGRSATVTGYYPQGELDIFKITFEDGRTAEACPEHLWEVHHKHWNGKYKKGESRIGAARPRLMRTREIVELLSSNKGKFAVRLAEEVEKPVADLPLDPYLLGALLGDGCMNGKSFRFSSVDEHILSRVSGQLESIGHELHHDDYAPDCDFRVRNGENPIGVISPLRAGLRRLGLEGTLSDTKFIPEVYKEGSVDQRWALVQGLMDTDGSADSRHGSLSYSTSSKRLAEDFQDVVRSLGGMAKVATKKTSYRNDEGEVVKGKLSYRITIRHPRPASFFSLPRKTALVDKPYQYAETLKLGIKSIEFSRRAEAACILVDHEDHLFITDEYVVTHNTETLLGFASNAVSWGSGFLFCDGKGDVALFAKVYALARRFGREDDLLVLNYMTGNTDIGLSYGEKRSNTLNPFATGSSDGLTQMVVGLMDDTGGDGAMWKGRATAMFTGVMRALTWLRDQQLIDLNVSEIRDHLQLKRIIDLANPEQYEQMPMPIRKSIKSYLTSLPGYKESQGYNQSQTTLDQHGYLEMQFTKILGSLADVYGHIFHTPHAEVDMADVVLNRRILVIMLPALEKSKDEIANLGKIVVATLKGMMGGTLGNKVEGNWGDIVENRPTNSPSPFIVVLDEVGYYMVDGMDLMAAQARSLGFAMVFAGQDINAMKRLNEKVFGSVQGNTNTKIIMRTEDPDTAKLAIDAGGKAYRAQLGSYQGQPGELGKTYSDNMEARLELVDRVNSRDLKDQDEGEMHIFHKDWMIRARGFYAAPESTLNKRKLRLRPNHFITVSKPNREMLDSQQKLPEIVDRLVSEEFIEMMKAAEQNAIKNISAPTEVEVVFRTYDQLSRSKTRVPNPVEASCVAFGRLMEVNQGINDIYNDGVRAGRPGAGTADPFARPPVAGGFDRGIPDMGSGMDDFYGDRSGFPGSRQPDFAPRGGAHEMDGFAGGADGLYGDRDGFSGNRYRGGVPDEFDRGGISQPSAPFRQPKYKQDVPHGVELEGDQLHGMASRIANNKAVMTALATLDYDENRMTPDKLNDEIEEAIDIANIDDDAGWGPATPNDVARAASMTHSALPDDDDDDGGDDTSSGVPAGGGLTAELLGMLIDGEDQD